MRRKILEDMIEGCLPIAVGFIVAVMFCLMITLCSCKPQQKIVEVERLTHDTVSVKDTDHIKDIVVVHDSVYTTNTIQETVHDTVTNNVAWKYFTFDSIGNVTSLLDYTSNVTQGRTAQKSHESEQKAVSGKVAILDRKASHKESKGSSDLVTKKEQVKVSLTGWQKFVMGMGYIFIIALTLGLMLGGMALYGKWKKL